MSYEIDWSAGTITLPGFVDAHLHYPQTEIIGSWGADLLDWLERYTFPEESRFGDRTHADRVAKLCVDELVSHGVTTACVFSTIHPEAFAAIVNAAAGRLHLVTGITAMDRNAPDSLQISAKDYERENKIAYDYLKTKHRMTYAVTPRFAITSTAEQLEVCGDFHGRHADTLMQTHINENDREIAFTAQLFPDASDYLNVYERFGLVTDRSLFAHGIYGSQSEFDRMADAGASVVHCPTSNTFLGSGLFNPENYTSRGATIALGSDIGGGLSFSPWVTMAEAYKIARFHGHSLTATQLIDWHTMGGAKALGLADKIGSLAPGKYRDYNVYRLAPTSPLVKARLDRAKTSEDVLFALLFMMNECRHDVHVERHFEGFGEIF